MDIPQKKAGFEIPYDTTILLLRIYPKDPQAQYRKDIFTPMILATLSTLDITQMFRTSDRIKI